MNNLIRFCLAYCLCLVIPAVFAEDLGQVPGDPLDHLPSNIRKLNDWGQRADFSHDGSRILFLEKTYGDAFELDLTTGKITPLTHHYYHGGYTRALYLSNGDILLSGCTTFDADHPKLNRGANAELWVLDKSLTHPPVRLGTHCSEGPAVSRTQLRIAWTTRDVQYPDTYAKREHRIHVGDIVYREGVPELVDQRVVLSNVTNPFFDEPIGIETQNFIRPDEGRITMSLYGYLGGSQTSIVDLDTGEVTLITDTPNHHNEPEGIFPDGKSTLAESSRQFLGHDLEKPVQFIDIWKLSLDGSEQWERITHFTDYEGYKSSNPVVSDDGRFIAFQMAKLGDPAGVGRGLFILDLSQENATSVEGAFSAEATLEARAEKDAHMRDEATSPFNYEKHPVEFTPLKYFEPKADWVFESRLEVFAEPEAVTIFDTKGRERKGHIYGRLSFTRDDTTHQVRVYRMEAKDEVYHAIWFTDQTTGESTYEVGRYVDFELSEDPDHVYTLDFNAAYNPWCAYSPAYGCAIPQEDDYLDLAIEAGEIKWHD